jgi:hypothetical protein
VATVPFEHVTPFVNGPLILYIAEGALGGNAPKTTIAVPENAQFAFSFAQKV